MPRKHFGHVIFYKPPVNLQVLEQLKSLISQNFILRAPDVAIVNKPCELDEPEQAIQLPRIN